MGVDLLPVIVGDHQWLAFGQPGGQLVGVVGAHLTLRFAGQVLPEILDGVLRVALVGADHPGRSALDPAGHIVVGAADHLAPVVRDGAPAVVEGQTRHRHPVIADRAHHQIHRERLPLTGVARHHAAVVLEKFVAAQLDLLDAPRAFDRHRGGAEPEDDPSVPGPRFAGRVVAQHLDVGGLGLAGGLGVLVADAGQVGWVDDDVDALQFAELAHLQGGERRLQRPAAPDDDHLGDPALAQRVQGVIGDVGGGQDLGVGHQDAGDVDGDVAVAHHDGPAGGDVGCHLGEVRVGVVPADEVDGRHAAGQVLAGDSHGPIGLGAHRVDHRVVAVGKLVDRDILSHSDIAEEPEPGVG